MDDQKLTALAKARLLRRAMGSPHDVPLPESDQIRQATLADLKFIDHLQRKFANCVGFLPKVAIETLTEQGHVKLAIQNGEGAGYILSRRRLKWQPHMRSITQACVAMDAQRRHHGLALLSVVEAEARAEGLSALQACCAVSLDSNNFWRAAGFIPIVHMRPANVRGREIICWRKPLIDRLPAWFAMPPKHAGHHAAIPNTTRDPNRSTDAQSIARLFLTGRSTNDTAQRRRTNPI
jgi:N-acetylglutamate synthase-like GNAT family acetyltransferase